RPSRRCSRPPRRAVRRLPGPATAHRRRALHPTAAGPADHGAGQALPDGDQGQPARPAGGDADGVGPGGPRDGGCDLPGDKSGRVVTRRLWTDTETAAYGPDELSCPGLRIRARVDCWVRKGGRVLSAETRYFACSLDPERVASWELLRLIRGHWAVENSLHHIKDRWWDE